MKRTMLFAAGCIPVLAACGSLMQTQGVQPVQPITTCSNTQCSVQLHVDDKCHVTEPGTLQVTRKNSVITWTADNSSVRFANHGIEINNPPSGIFSDDPGNPGNRSKFVIHNKNQKKNGTDTNYKYTIRLEGLSNCQPVDPVIMNDCTDPNC